MKSISSATERHTHVWKCAKQNAARDYEVSFDAMLGLCPFLGAECPRKFAKCNDFSALSKHVSLHVQASFPAARCSEKKDPAKMMIKCEMPNCAEQ